MTSCSVFTTARLLVSLLACTTLTLAAPPGRQKASLSKGKEQASSQAPGNFEWAVTSFRHHPEKGPQLRSETSTEYLNRIHGDPASHHEYVHSLHPTYRKDYVKAFRGRLKKAHEAKEINNAEYQVFKNNVDVQIKGLDAVKQGQAVQIEDTVHHPLQTPLEAVAADYYDEKTAKMVLHPIKGVKPTEHGTIVHAMNFLEAPPKYPHEERKKVQLISIQNSPAASANPSAAVHAAVKLEPHTGEGTRGTVASQFDKGKDAAASVRPTHRSWRVTSDRPVKQKNMPPYFTEGVEQYRQRNIIAQGKAGGIRPYVWTPHPTVHDPANHGRFLFEHLPKLKANGYPQERIDVVHHNEKEISKAWRYINEEKGAVYFPDSVHHHSDMDPSEVIWPKEDTKIGHMKVTQYPEGNAGGKYRLRFVPSRHESLRLQSAQASSSKRTHQGTDEDNSKGSAADKKQRNA